jgi:cobalamin biosynthesis Mg chelatase CobN
MCLTFLAADIENTGTYEWTPEETLPAGDDYAIQIVSEDGEVNYTSLLTIKSSAAPKPKPKSSASATTTSTTKAAESSVYPSKTKTSDVPHHTIVASNSTIATSTRYSNSTASSTRSSTRPSASSDVEVSPVPSAPADSGAIGVIRSPLALVACLVGAIVYFN